MINRASCQVPAPGRVPILIVYHLEHLSLSSQTEHSLDEVIPVTPIQPGRAHNQVLPMTPTHSLFPLPLAATIRPKWCGGIIFAVGTRSRVIKNVISGHMEQQKATLLARY